MLKKILGYTQANYSTGQVITDPELCTGCRQCTLICPATALEMNDQKKSQMRSMADCISCGACTAVCHTTAITIKNFYHVPDGMFATSGRIQPVNNECYPRYFPPKKEGK